MSATALTDLLWTFKFFISISEEEGTILPFHLLGLKGLIGVIASFFEFNDKIGPPIDKLYAVLPAGVETNTPSQINFFIKNFFLLIICSDAACLVCLNKETSLIAIFVYLFPVFVTTLISRGEM